MDLETLRSVAHARNGAVIADLFGGVVTKPNTIPPKHIENAAEGFMEFWTAWPKSDRKAARQQCLDRWAKHGFAADWKRIVAHVEYMKKSKDWQKDEGSFIPAPAVYLNQQRWSEWEYIVERPKQPTALDKIKAEAPSLKPPSEAQREALRGLRERIKGMRA